MNKSKFLKKSLAAILSVLLIVAMIPLSAAAATWPEDVTPVPGSGFAFTGDVATSGNIFTVEYAYTSLTPTIIIATKNSSDDIVQIKKSGTETTEASGDSGVTEFTLQKDDAGKPVPFEFYVKNATTNEESAHYIVNWSIKAAATTGSVKSAAIADTSSLKDLTLVNVDNDKKEITFTVPFGTSAQANTEFAYEVVLEGCTATKVSVDKFGASPTATATPTGKATVSGNGTIGTNSKKAVPQVLTAETQDGSKDVVYSVYVVEETGLTDIKVGDLETEIALETQDGMTADKGMETGAINVYVPSTLEPVDGKVKLTPTFSIGAPFTKVYLQNHDDTVVTPGSIDFAGVTGADAHWIQLKDKTEADFTYAYGKNAAVKLAVVSTHGSADYIRTYDLALVRNTDTALTKVVVTDGTVAADGTITTPNFTVEGTISGKNIDVTVPKATTLANLYVVFYGPKAVGSAPAYPKVKLGGNSQQNFTANGIAADSTNTKITTYTAPISVQVLAADGHTQRFYTLTVKNAEADTNNPMITAAGLVINKGKSTQATYTAAVDQSAHTLTFTVPHSTADTDVAPSGTTVYSFAKNDPAATVTVTSAVSTVKDGGKVSIKSGTSDEIVYSIKFVRSAPETGKSVEKMRLTTATNVNEIGYNNNKTYDVSITGSRLSVTLPNGSSATNLDFTLPKGAHLYKYDVDKTDNSAHGLTVTEIKPASDVGVIDATTARGLTLANIATNINGKENASQDTGWFIADEYLYVLIRDSDKSVLNDDNNSTNAGVVDWKVINNNSDLKGHKQDVQLYVTEKASSNTRIVDGSITDAKGYITSKIEGERDGRKITLNVPASYVLAKGTTDANKNSVRIPLSFKTEDPNATVTVLCNGSTYPVHSGGKVTYNTSTKELDKVGFAGTWTDNPGFVFVINSSDKAELQVGSEASGYYIFDPAGTSTGGKVVFQVKAEDGTTENYVVKEVKVNDPEKGALITKATIGGVDASIDNTAKTITVNLPFGTNLGQLKTELTASKLAGVYTNSTLTTAWKDGTKDLRIGMKVYVQSEDKAVTNAYTIIAKTGVRFTDVPEDAWFAPYVKEAADKGIVKGIGENQFGPNTYITRQDFVVMTGRMMGITVDENAVVSFTDADKISDYAKPYVAYFAKEGVVGGVGDGTFNPTANITRSEAAKILAVALDREITGTSTFADKSTIAAWAEPYVAACQKAGIFNGDENNNFFGTKMITRAETAKVMVDSLKIK